MTVTADDLEASPPPLPGGKPGTIGAAAPGAVVSTWIRRRRTRVAPDRGALSQFDWKRRTVRYPWNGMHLLLLLSLVIMSLGPLLLLAKFAITPTQDILKTPFAWFPNGVAWSNVTIAWNEIDIKKYFINTLIVAAGSWFFQIVVATTGGFVISVLRPWWGRLLNAAVLTTLFVPAIVLLVPLYKIVVHPPIGESLINNYFAVWLPAAASAFNVVLVARFFDSLPREIFEAARVDGAGPFRLFWSIVLPMSKPIIGVVSVFAVIASWKDFLWPLLVLSDPNLQPLSVRLPALQATTDKGVLMAALAISTLIPIVLFLVFQRMFLRGAGLGGAIKG